jgi:DNA-directed RNA polymerase sigma subunit (sigma70/sigma32)
MSFLDLIQTHAIGLLVAIDKFNPTLSDTMTEAENLAAYKVFRSVALGRMCGDRIEAYNATLLHLWPIDARRVYRAHKASRFLDRNADIDQIVAAVNENIPPKHHVTAPEIQGLMAAASHVSGDSAADQETGDTTLECYMDDEEHRPDFLVERSQAWSEIHAGLQSLSVLEQKLIRLQGIAL